jgi:hypothetical protein
MQTQLEASGSACESLAASADDSATCRSRTAQNPQEPVINASRTTQDESETSSARRRFVTRSASLWALLNWPSQATAAQQQPALPPSPDPLPSLPSAPQPLPTLPSGSNALQEPAPQMRPSAAPAPRPLPAPPTGGVLDLPLLQQGHITFLGSFAMPEEWWSWGIGYAGNNQFIAANAQNRGIRIYNIPQIGGTATLAASGATLPSWGSSGNGWIPGGNIRINGRVFSGQYQMYDVADTPWLFQTIDESLSGGWTAPQRPQSYGVPLRGLVGSFGVIPAEYRSLFNGYDLFSCNVAGKSIISNSTWGPSFMAFPSSAATTGGAVPSMLLMGYDSGGLSGNTLTGGKLLPEVTTIAGAGIVPGTRSLIVFGVEASSTCYGTGARCGSPCSESQGYHGYPHTAVVYAFDLRELVLVRDGAKHRSSVRPYATEPGGVMGSHRGWALTGFDKCWTVYNKSAFFDPVTKRIYMTNQWHDSRVYVWQVR